MQPVQNVVQLRQLLAEKFPGLRQSAERLEERRSVWPTGLPQIDRLLDGGLPKGGITELVAPASGSGSALLLTALLHQAARTNQLVALIDGQDSFDPTAFDQPVLSRLLWVRCRTTGEAMKSADLILRDRNLSLVLLDLQINPESQLRRIPSSTWFRLQRIVEHTSSTVLALTPRALAHGCLARVILKSRFDLGSLERGQDELMTELSADFAELRSVKEHLRQSA